MQNEGKVKEAMKIYHGVIQTDSINPDYKMFAYLNLLDCYINTQKTEKKTHQITDL